MKRERYRTGEKAFTRKEWDKLMAAVGRLDDEVLFTLAVNTGIRREDMVNISIGDMSPDNRSITYYERKKRRTRTIFINSEMARRISMYLNTIPKSQPRLFGFSSKTAYNKLQRACDIAGIPRRPFHALRATCVKFCQQAGWSPEEVSELTGDSIRVIQEHYSTPSITEMQEIAETKKIM